MSAAPRIGCAVVLCGGKGRRLRGVIGAVPKPMAPVCGAPFLDHLITHLRRNGINRIVLCTGYRSGVIERRYAGGFCGAEISISREQAPLGTGGAVKLAEPMIKCDPFLLVNGDSFCGADLGRFAAFHRRKRGIASIVLAEDPGRKDAGTVALGAQGELSVFSEKKGGGRLVNAGVYLLSKKALSGIPAGRFFSLEHDLFPRLRRCYGFRSRARLLDIGTPERYRAAQRLLKGMLK